MKFIGDEMLHSGEVISTEFVDNAIKFNRIHATNISSVDLQNANENVIITTKDDHNIRLYNPGIANWDTWDDITKRNRITLDSNGDQFNYIHFLNDDIRYLEVDNLLLNGMDNTATFVIDWWMFQYSANNVGCLLFNGSTSSPDPVTNNELCITTSGDIIDPDTLEVTTNSANDGYLNILYPPLKSTNQINNGLWHHYALVAKDGVIQLIIDAKVNDETTFDGISDVENVLFGYGYSNGIEAYVGKMRITKGTDLGWFGGNFDLPDSDIVPDGNTEFLMDSTSLVDTSANYTITVHGDNLSIYQENHYIYLQPSYCYSIVKLDFSSEQILYLPPGVVGNSYIIHNSGTDRIVIKSLHDDSKHLYFYPITESVILEYIVNDWYTYSERNTQIISKAKLDDMESQGIYITTVDGTIDNLGSDIRCTGGSQDVTSDYSPVHAYEAKVIDMRNSNWVFASTLNESGGYTNTTFEVEFYLKMLSSPASNWRMLGDASTAYDAFGIDYMNTSYFKPACWCRWSNTGADYVETFNTYNGNYFNVWLHMKIKWYSILYSSYNDIIVRHCLVQIYDPLTGSLRYSFDAPADNAQYNIMTSFRMVNTFFQGPYLVSEFKQNRL